MGNEFRKEDIKKLGKQAVVVAIFQSLTACVFVDVALIGLHFLMPQTLSLSVAITLGAIATATAPAATLMIVKQYKTSGPVTRILLPVVALDDVVGLIVFAVSFGIARALEHGTVDIFSVVIDPILEVIASLALGALLGAIFTFTERFFHSRSKRLSISVCYVFLAVALSKMTFKLGPVTIGFSSLLVCMMVGTIFCNFCDFSDELMGSSHNWHCFRSRSLSGQDIRCPFFVAADKMRADSSEISGNHVAPAGRCGSWNVNDGNVAW